MKAIEILKISCWSILICSLLLGYWVTAIVSYDVGYKRGATTALAGHIEYELRETQYGEMKWYKIRSKE